MQKGFLSHLALGSEPPIATGRKNNSQVSDNTKQHASCFSGGLSVLTVPEPLPYMCPLCPHRCTGEELSNF